MALQTPRQRGLQRPSFSPSNTTTTTTNSHLSASTAVNRKASLRALTGDPRTPAGSNTNNNKMDGSELEVGDAVNVPGDMYGVVKFFGNVRGKNGRFVGVELDREFAAKGKNDGDVDGISYFHTTNPGAGIFLPVHRAEKRAGGGGALSPSAISTSSSPNNFPATPSHSTLNGHSVVAAKNTPPTPALPHKFAQSVGPGARPSSPLFKPKRPSLPRPESPFRKQPPNLAPNNSHAYTPGRTLSQSQRGGVRPGLTPGKSTLKSSVIGRPSGQTPRPYSRTGSRMGRYNETVMEEDDRTPVGVAATTNGRTTSTGSVPSFSQPLRSPSRLGSAGGPDQEVQRLKSLLTERDRRLEEQAASLADMENSVKELSALIPQDGGGGITPGGPSRKGSLDEDHQQTSASQLRQMLREKNEKISLLTAEFDAHRADFRSTLDSLEMASTETERVYEEQKRDLLAQLAVLRDAGQSREDFEGVARQLKGLEELVAELEEGLEESRRGEAEARGEVEFLRGEVERGRSELRRERERGAGAGDVKSGGDGNGVGWEKEMEMKDDEIRGLKAIIHDLSGSEAAPAVANDGNAVSSSKEVERLQTALEVSQREKEALEREIEQLRREEVVVASSMNGNHGFATHARNESERTATAPESAGEKISGRLRGDTIKAASAHTIPERGPLTSNGGVYCEMCESAEHDTLDCTSLQQERGNGMSEEDDGGNLNHRGMMGDCSPGKENEYAVTNGNGNGVGKEVEEDKWCALCEKDGHLAFDCPEEQY